MAERGRFAFFVVVFVLNRKKEKLRFLVCNASGLNECLSLQPK